MKKAIYSLLVLSFAILIIASCSSGKTTPDEDQKSKLRSENHSPQIPHQSSIKQKESQKPTNIH